MVTSTPRKSSAASSVRTAAPTKTAKTGKAAVTAKASKPLKRGTAASEEAAPQALEEPSTQPSLRFMHSQAMRKQTLKVLSAMEQADAPGEHRAALADMVVVLMTAGMDFYFLAPLKQAKAGFVIQQSANLGMVGVQQLMGGVIRNIIGRMDGPALLSVCGSIRSMMH
ncbi:hypothetical protein LNV08_07335 [Paucibacter sp. TC2R-5]|uniref:hypothetical protein n=1 Tax=Paucibacter sp. TC2R-5 TaxID=2893555 RepID=UPI0021E3607B|nr:hypothetical protein [Paucibacter sp. TC2R-5]MCV2358790.1 hypothetical protein [Paucibacter sp. TC2R-5]